MERASHVARKSRNGGGLLPVQAATTSWIVHGVTMTMKPKLIAAIVREAEVDSRLSWATS